MNFTWEESTEPVVCDRCECEIPEGEYHVRVWRGNQGSEIYCEECYFAVRGGAE